MKKSVSRFLAMMGMAQAFGVNPADPIAPAEPTEGVKRSKPRFVAGDHFYKMISMKRVKGKWRLRK